MSFDNPYFPQSFDVGTVGGPHTHIDSTGVQVINGTQKIVLAPSSVFNPAVVAVELFTGDAGEVAPGILYEIKDAGYWPGLAGNAGDVLRATLFDSQFVTAVSAQIELVSGSRDGSKGAFALVQASDRFNGNPAGILLDGDSMSVQIGRGLFPLNIGGILGVGIFNCIPNQENFQVYWGSGGTQLFLVSNNSGFGNALTWDGASLAVHGYAAVDNTIFVAGAVASPMNVAHIEVKNSAIGDIGIAIQAIIGQTGAQQEWRNSAGVYQTRMDSGGNINSRHLGMVKGELNPGAGGSVGYVWCDAGGNLNFTTPGGNVRVVAAGP